MVNYYLVDDAHRDQLPSLMNLYSESVGVKGHPRLLLVNIHGGHFYILASKNSDPAAFVECTYHQRASGKKWIEIEAYYTRPKYERQGLAKRLTAKVALKARAEKLDVVSIPYPAGHIPRMVRRLRELQEKIPKEARAVRMRTHLRSKRVVFGIRRRK